jgi:hypothetical protein
MYVRVWTLWMDVCTDMCVCMHITIYTYTYMHIFKYISLTHLAAYMKHHLTIPITYTLWKISMPRNIHTYECVHQTKSNNRLQTQGIAACAATDNDCTLNIGSHIWLYLLYVWKTNKHTNYSFSLLIMYGSSYMFQHYIAIPREHSYSLLRDAQLKSSQQNTVDGRVVSSDVVCTSLRRH